MTTVKFIMIYLEGLQKFLFASGKLTFHQSVDKNPHS